MRSNGLGQRLEDSRPQGVLTQLGTSRSAGTTNVHRPTTGHNNFGDNPGRRSAGRPSSGAVNTSQPPPSTPGTSDAGEHNPFTGRRGLPSFSNLTVPGLEGLNAQDMLGQGGARPAQPAARGLSTTLSNLNDEVVMFEASRDELPPVPDDDSQDLDDSDPTDNGKAPDRTLPTRDPSLTASSRQESLCRSPTTTATWKRTPP
ncbi:hypothetical protein VUR80DRAFT_613 [Thermomyces stellatus]